MDIKIIGEENISKFTDHLLEDEKSEATVEKYLRDVRAFAKYVGYSELTKQKVLEYKRYLTKRYAPSSVNSMLASVNSFLRFLDKADCVVKFLRIQRQMFVNEKRELGTAEYCRLLDAAGDSRLSYVIQTICETGIRVSELEYITVEAVKRGKAVVECKNKTRIIFISSSLRKILIQYVKKSGITTGRVFVTRTGRALNRSNIWRDMKRLCRQAGVNPEKVFPHNLRHLFARTFYSAEHDIVRLADLLGHSSINTTRVYTAETGREHISCFERMHVLLTT